MDDHEIMILIEASRRLIAEADMQFHRYLYTQIYWDEDLCCIKGPKGAGKTTLILQHIKETFGEDSDRAVYFALDHIWFADHRPIEAVDYFYKNGYTHLFIDEVHHYPEWSRFIKTVADTYPGMKVVYSGSSILKLDKGSADLSRRQTEYRLKGMSFREFLEYESGEIFPAAILKELTENHRRLAAKICKGRKIIPLFKKYLKCGCYPFYRKSPEHFAGRLQEVVNTVLSVDLPAVEGVTPPTVRKAKKMLMVLAKSCPQQPNMSELYRELETERNMGLRLLEAMERAELFAGVDVSSPKLRHLSRPEKIFLGDTNLMYALVGQPDIGSLRETFFVNQLRASGHEVLSPQKGDFIVDGGPLFEIGGVGKGFNQIKDVANSYVANDDTEVGVGNKIPLWLFGFLY